MPKVTPRVAGRAGMGTQAAASAAYGAGVGTLNGQIDGGVRPFPLALIERPLLRRRRSPPPVATAARLRGRVGRPHLQRKLASARWAGLRSEGGARVVSSPAAGGAEGGAPRGRSRPPRRSALTLRAGPAPRARGGGSGSGGQ